MAQDDDTKRRPGRPRGKREGEQIEFKLPKGHFDYLKHLVDVKKRLGSSVHEAARHIVIRELDAMMNDAYEKKGID